MVDSSAAHSGEMRWMSGLAVIVLCASIVAFVVGGAAGVPVASIYLGYVRTILIVGPVALIAIALACLPIAIARGTKLPLTEGSRHLARRIGSADAALGTLGPIFLIPLFMGAFGTFKQIMPRIAPFAWDDTFAEAGRVLFFGYRPWQLTHALFGGAGQTAIIDAIYFAWLPTLFLTVFAMAILAPPALRARFFVSFVTAWLLLGVIAAYLLSSAGPVYASMVGANSDFSPLIEKLHSSGGDNAVFGTLRWQKELWSAYSQQRYSFGYGISAMPSLHNAIAFLYALCAWRGGIWARTAASAFAGAILLGSVHLGWHYIADGLVAWAGMYAIWRGAGAYLRWCGYEQNDMQEPVGAPGPEALAT